MQDLRSKIRNSPAERDPRFSYTTKNNMINRDKFQMINSKQISNDKFQNPIATLFYVNRYMVSLPVLLLVDRLSSFFNCITMPSNYTGCDVVKRNTITSILSLVFGFCYFSEIEDVK